MVSPISLSLYAQSAEETVAISVIAMDNHAPITDESSVNYLDFSKQCIVGLSTPKDSLAIEAGDTENLTTIDNEKSSSQAIAAYSGLAKDIIENFRYDFSETFIDILFFEDIDLARIRTI